MTAALVQPSTRPGPQCAHAGCADRVHSRGLCRRHDNQLISALAVGLGVLKRVVEAHHEAMSEAAAKAGRGASATATSRATRKATGTGLDRATREARRAFADGRPVPSARALATRYHIGRARAGEVRALVLAEADGHGGHPGPLASP